MRHPGRIGDEEAVAIRIVLQPPAEAAQRLRAQGGERQARANLKKAREAADQMLIRVAGRLEDVPHMERARRELMSAGHHGVARTERDGIRGRGEGRDDGERTNC